MMKYDPDFWVELTHSYIPTMRARLDLLAKHRSQIFFHNPSAELACRELMEMVLSFLTLRYPAHFSLSPDHTTFHNRLLATTTDLATTHPLTALFLNVPEDYAVMLRHEATGEYHLRAGAACSSVGWNIGLHRDRPLRAIHTHVPDYAAKMERSMDRYFARLPTDAPIMRCSWSLEDHEVMFSSPDLGSPADGGGIGQHTQGEWRRSAFDGRPERMTVDEVLLRCDAQTLRRLPVSGAVVFNFRAIFTPLRELRRERYVPALLCKVLEEGRDDLIEYKCIDRVRELAIGALREWREEQVREGLVEEGWDVSTLAESPFFPGWEDKWRGGQGR